MEQHGWNSRCLDHCVRIRLQHGSGRFQIRADSEAAPADSALCRDRQTRCVPLLHGYYVDALPLQNLGHQ